jgi:hypothetical protein
MTAQSEDVPQGAAVLPLIPAELKVHPLLVAVLHATVFLSGSEEALVNPDAAGEALEYLAGYLQRLSGSDLERVRADMECLVAFARQENWPRPDVQFLKKFLADFGVGESES